MEILDLDYYQNSIGCFFTQDCPKLAENCSYCFKHVHPWWMKKMILWKNDNIARRVSELSVFLQVELSVVIYVARDNSCKFDSLLNKKSPWKIGLASTSERFIFFFFYNLPQPCNASVCMAASHRCVNQNPTSFVGQSDFHWICISYNLYIQELQRPKARKKTVMWRMWKDSDYIQR